MKIRVTLKDPDTMQDAVVDAMAHEVKSLVGLSDYERRSIASERSCTVQSDITSKWMPYGEYLIVEFDTEAGTATVLPASALN